MKLWRELRENAAKWGARITAGLVALIMLCEGAHSIGLLDMWRVPQGAILEALVVGSITLAFLLIEEFGRTEKNVELLAEQQAASMNISRFVGPFEFHSRWKHLRETYDTFLLQGYLGKEFSAELGKIQQREKRCSYYISIDTDSLALARKFLAIAALSSPDDFKLYESASFGESSWIVARNKSGNETEALVCYFAGGDESLTGLHLRGSAAKDYSQYISEKLETRTVDGETSAFIRLYTEAQIEAVLGEKHVFRQAILDIDKGTLLKGVEDVCHAMKQQLAETKKKLDVTHICSERTVPLMKEKYFLDWLAANYTARKRNVEITRVFIVPKALRTHPVLNEVIQQMRDHRVTVRICDREKLEDRFLEDFSLYDDQHVIYISREGGAWLDEEQTQARRSDSLERVKHFRHIFDIVNGRAS